LTLRWSEDSSARGYLLKDAQREELLDSIRRVHIGEICIPASLVAKLAASASSEELTGRESRTASFWSRYAESGRLSGGAKILAPQQHFGLSRHRARLS
jgi:two-component system NarL family response regulator